MSFNNYNDYNKYLKPLQEKVQNKNKKISEGIKNKGGLIFEFLGKNIKPKQEKNLAEERENEELIEKNKNILKKIDYYIKLLNISKDEQIGVAGDIYNYSTLEFLIKDIERCKIIYLGALNKMNEKYGNAPNKKHNDFEIFLSNISTRKEFNEMLNEENRLLESLLEYIKKTFENIEVSSLRDYADEYRFNDYMKDAEDRNIYNKINSVKYEIYEIFKKIRNIYRGKIKEELKENDELKKDLTLNYNGNTRFVNLKNEESLIKFQALERQEASLKKEFEKILKEIEDYLNKLGKDDFIYFLKNKECFKKFYKKYEIERIARIMKESVIPYKNFNMFADVLISSLIKKFNSGKINEKEFLEKYSKILVFKQKIKNRLKVAVKKELKYLFKGINIIKLSYAEYKKGIENSKDKESLKEEKAKELLDWFYEHVVKETLINICKQYKKDCEEIMNQFNENYEKEERFVDLDVEEDYDGKINKDFFLRECKGIIKINNERLIAKKREKEEKFKEENNLKNSGINEKFNKINSLNVYINNLIQELNIELNETKESPLNVNKVKTEMGKARNNFLHLINNNKKNISGNNVEKEKNEIYYMYCMHLNDLKYKLDELKKEIDYKTNYLENPDSEESTEETYLAIIFIEKKEKEIKNEIFKTYEKIRDMFNEKVNSLKTEKPEEKATTLKNSEEDLIDKFKENIRKMGSLNKNINKFITDLNLELNDENLNIKEVKNEMVNEWGKILRFREKLKEFLEKIKSKSKTMSEKKYENAVLKLLEKFKYINEALDVYVKYLSNLNNNINILAKEIEEENKTFEDGMTDDEINSILESVEEKRGEIKNKIFETYNEIKKMFEKKLYSLENR